MGRRFKILLSLFLILGSLCFLFLGLVYGKSFLVPITTAIILSMLMNPVASWLIKHRIGRVWAVLISDFIIIVFISFMIFLLVAQANNVAQSWPEIEKRVLPKIEQVQKMYDERVKNPVNDFGNGNQNGESGEKDQPQEANQQNTQQSQNQQGQQQHTLPSGQQKQNGQGQNQQDSLNEQSGKGPIHQLEQQSEQDGQLMNIEKKIPAMLAGIVSNVFSFISYMLLILVYIFFFMFYHRKFENAIVGMFPEKDQEKARTIINDASSIAQKYLLGRLILIAILAVLYMIAFSISGIEHAIFVSLLAALFSLLPFVGNIIALGLALGMSFIGGGETGQIVIILISFGIIQFIESYILEPYVVGDKVDLNPVVIIVGIVLGGLVWGVMGMILVIPILGILKVVFDSIEPLRPLGYVLDGRDVSSEEGGWTEKVKEWFMKKIKKI